MRRDTSRAHTLIALPNRCECVRDACRRCECGSRYMHRAGLTRASRCVPASRSRHPRSCCTVSLSRCTCVSGWLLAVLAAIRGLTSARPAPQVCSRRSCPAQRPRWRMALSLHAATFRLRPAAAVRRPARRTMAARAALSTEELQREATKAFLGEAASKVTFAPTSGGTCREQRGFRRRSAGDCGEMLLATRLL